MGYDAKITEITNYGLVEIRAHSDLISRCTDVLDIEFPARQNSSVYNDDIRILWLGPERWLLTTHASLDDEAADTLNKSFDEQHGIATVRSDQYSVFNLTGSDSRAVLTQGCSIDLDPSVFQVGHCTACAFARTAVILCCLNPGESYKILVESSLSQYLSDWFSNAIK